MNPELELLLYHIQEHFVNSDFHQREKLVCFLVIKDLEE